MTSTPAFQMTLEPCFIVATSIINPTLNDEQLVMFQCEALNFPEENHACECGECDTDDTNETEDGCDGNCDDCACEDDDDEQGTFTYQAVVDPRVNLPQGQSACRIVIIQNVEGQFAGVLNYRIITIEPLI